MPDPQPEGRGAPPPAGARLAALLRKLGGDPAEANAALRDLHARTSADIRDSGHAIVLGIVAGAFLTVVAAATLDSCSGRSSRRMTVPEDLESLAARKLARLPPPRAPSLLPRILAAAQPPDARPAR